MKLLTRALLFLTLTTVSLGASAQDSREYIRNSISGWGECRNVSITRTNGDLAIYGANGTSRSSVPSALDQNLVELNNNHNYIDDVCLTENGNWVILYDNNCFWWNGIPYSLEQKLRQFNGDGETVTSVTFNDSGEWMVVTTSHIAASNQTLQDWLVEGCEKWGTLWSVHVADDGGAVAVYEKGYRYRGNVPQELKNRLGETDINVYRAKHAGNSWFFADKQGNYEYNM